MALGNMETLSAEMLAEWKRIMAIELPDHSPFTPSANGIRAQQQMASRMGRPLVSNHDPAQLEADVAFNKAAKFVIDVLKAVDSVNMDQGARDAIEEIIIGKVAMNTAKAHGDAFDSFRFYAKCKGKTE